MACVAGCSYMFTFLAGATTSGARVARQSVVSRSFARPCASRASTWAVAGATSTTSAQSASSMCEICDSSAGENRSERTG